MPLADYWLPFFSLLLCLTVYWYWVYINESIIHILIDILHKRCVTPASLSYYYCISDMNGWPFKKKIKLRRKMQQSGIFDQHSPVVSIRKEDWLLTILLLLLSSNMENMIVNLIQIDNECHACDLNIWQKSVAIRLQSLLKNNIITRFRYMQTGKYVSLIICS